MADVTLERLAEGIRRANAKGDIETVKKLGMAYRQKQGQGGGAQPPQVSPEPPAGARPGSREYADWAAAASRAGIKLPQVSDLSPKFAPERDSSLLDLFAQGTTFGWGDELRGVVQGGISATSMLPIRAQSTRPGMQLTTSGEKTRLGLLSLRLAAVSPLALLPLRLLCSSGLATLPARCRCGSRYCAAGRLLSPGALCMAQARVATA